MTPTTRPGFSPMSAGGCSAGSAGGTSRLRASPGPGRGRQLSRYSLGAAEVSRCEHGVISTLPIQEDISCACSSPARPGSSARQSSTSRSTRVRVDPEQSDRLVATTPAEGAVMRSRPVHGWLRPVPEDLRTRRELEKSVKLGATYAFPLPPKRSRATTMSRRSGACASRCGRVRHSPRGPQDVGCRSRRRHDADSMTPSRTDLT
jgi:hypothetical protein